MADVYKVTRSDLVSVADAIRERAQTSDPLVFPDGFVTAVSNLGGSGATLTVTTPAEGVTVTVTKGELNYTKTTGADCTAVFSGLETGTWTITISDGTQTATGSVSVDADYATELTFFSATINITYPAGLVCTATDGVITLTAPDTSGTWACVVPNVGTWTVSLDNGFSESVDITQHGEVQTIDKWYLYKSGDERTYITGGWETLNNANIYNNYMFVREAVSDDYKYSNVHTKNKIDLTQYTVLNVRMKTDKTSSHGHKTQIAVSSSASTCTGGSQSGVVTKTQPNNNTSEFTATLDIQSVSGEYYITLGGGYLNHLYVYEVWLS